MKTNRNSTLTALATVLALQALACDAMTLVGNVDGGMTDPDAGTPQANGNRQDGGGTCTPQTYAGDVPFTLPVRRAMFGSLTPVQRLRRRIEDALVGAGLSEVYTPSLVPTGDQTLSVTSA